MKITLHTSDQPYFQEKWTDHALPLLVRITERHGALIRKLVFSHADLDNGLYFCRILSTMPLLQELTLHRITLGNVDANDANPVMLSKLNKLTVSTCHWNIFQFFMTAPIKELQITNKFGYVDAQQREIYMKFLEASDKLESIELDLMSYAKTFNVPLSSEICLKLKRLQYLTFSPSYEISDIDRNFGTFLESQCASLTELELNYVSPDNVKIIFTKLTLLEKLRLNAAVLPDQREFYGSFKQMHRLKELILHDDIASEVAVKEILVNCCNLETLTAHYDPGHYIPNLLTFMAANNPKLKNLSLDSLSVVMPPQVKFNHLKFLHIQTCHSLENVIKFLANNAAIETLSFTFADDSIIPDDAFVDALLNQYNLQHLIVDAGQIALNAILDKVNVDYGTLKTLEMRPLTWKRDPVRIEFPEDKSEWQAKQLLIKQEK